VILFEDPFLVGLPREHLLAKEMRVKAEHLSREDLLLLKDGHCLRDHALAACRLADRRVTEGFEATSLPTLVQMVDNGLGITLLPTLAVNAGLLLGTDLVTRPLLGHDAVRKIGLVWRRGTGRRDEFRLLAKELVERAKQIETGRAAITTEKQMRTASAVKPRTDGNLSSVYPISVTGITRWTDRDRIRITRATLNPYPMENSDAQEQCVCRCRRFDRDRLRTLGGLDHQCACSPFDRSSD
jgi:hypothetical protein